MESILNLKGLSGELNTLGILTLLSLIPIFIISMTTFTRNVIVFTFLRHALGLQQSPPNIVIIVLSLIITFFSMHPVFEKIYLEAGTPYLEKKIELDAAIEKAWIPMRSFLIAQTQEKDIHFIYKISKVEVPSSPEIIELQYLVPAFMLSELKLAFQIGFVIFLPFLLIDIVVAAMLTSLGMIMVPPITISLPIKIMLFVVIDGWQLITQVLVTSVIH